MRTRWPVSCQAETVQTFYPPCSAECDASNIPTPVCDEMRLPLVSFSLSPLVLPSHTCGTPGLIPNGVIHGSRYNMGDKIRYSCESGFVLEGHSILTCIVSPGSGAQWDFPSPFCRGEIFSSSFLSGCLSDTLISIISPFFFFSLP